MKMGRLAGVFVSAAFVLPLSACGGSEGEDILFDGQSFRASLDVDNDARQNFILSVRPVSASLEGAREAGRYEATVYCVNRYGSSDIIWVVGPDSPDEALPIADDTLTLQGSCREI
jgi:hypothetical protein